MVGGAGMLAAEKEVAGAGIAVPTPVRVAVLNRPVVVSVTFRLPFAELTDAGLKVMPIRQLAAGEVQELPGTRLNWLPVI